MGKENKDMVAPSEPATHLKTIYVPGPIALDLKDPAWAKAPEAAVHLSRRLNETGARMPFENHEIREIRLKALNNGSDIYFFCQWQEKKPGFTVQDTDLFADALALQFPLQAKESPICMGALHKPVNIIFWRADLAKPQNLVAGGQGTTQVSPDLASQNIRHYQSWDDGVWRIIIHRRMAASSENQVSFERGGEYTIALANWKGGSDAERGGHKIVVPRWQSLSVL